MANILQSLGDAIERQQQRKHENNMEVLRAIYTRPGMIVLGVILLGAALALIWPQIAPEADNTNSIVIDMSDLDFGDEEMNRTVQEMVENDRKQKEQSGRSGAIFFGLGAAVCFVRAAMPCARRAALRKGASAHGSADGDARSCPGSRRRFSRALSRRA